jgi:hypothetical protein
MSDTTTSCALCEARDFPEEDYSKHGLGRCIKRSTMSDNDFKFQISVKLGDALFNVRGATAAEFADNLAFAAKNASQVVAFCEDFKTPTTTQPSAGAVTPTSPSTPTPAPGALFPPNPAPPGAHRVTINGVEEKHGEGNDGKPWHLYKVTFSDGIVASTFDPLLASVVKKIYQEGSGCVAFTKPAKNPKYRDLESLQRAL